MSAPPGSINDSSIEGTGLSVADMKQILTDLGEDTLNGIVCSHMYECAGVTHMLNVVLHLVWQFSLLPHLCQTSQ